MNGHRETPSPTLSRYSLLVTAVLPVLVALALRAPASILSVVPAALGLNLLFRAERYAKDPQTRARFRLILPPVLAVSIALIVTAILIIPFSVYLAWFRMIGLGNQRGAVSRVFVYVTGFFAAVIAGRMYRKGRSGPTALLLTFLLLIVTMVIRSAWPVLLAVPVLVSAVVLQAEQDPGRRLARPLLVSAGGLVLLAMTIAFPIAAGGVVRGNRYIDNRLSPMLRRAVISIFPRYPLLHGGDGHGYSFAVQSLGGVPLLSPVPILEVRALPGERIYLRTDVFDHYSGTSWLRSAGLIERLKDPTPELTEVYTGDSPTAELPVTILTEFYEKVPHTLTTRTLTTGAGTTIEAVRGGFDAGFVLDLPLGRGDSLVLHRVLEDRPVSERNPGRNLQLPDEIPPEVRRIARDLGRGYRNPRDVLNAINRYLSDGFDYSLDTSSTLEQVDFVEDFLLGTRTGYCVHFATSLVVLARMNNIPARYVTGFLVSVPEIRDFEGDIFLLEYAPDADGLVSHRVTGYAAHAWAEVWLPDAGWVVWEATPAMRAGEVDDLAFLLASLDSNSITARQLREILGQVDDRRAALESDSSVNRNGWYPFLMIPSVTLAGVLLVGAGRRYVPVVDTRRAVHILAVRISRMALRRRIAPPGRTGWLVWSESMQSLLPDESTAIGSATEVIQRTYFGGHRPSHNEVALLRSVERTIAHRLPVGPGSLFPR